MRPIVFKTIVWELQLPTPVILDFHWISLPALRQELVLMMVTMMLKEYLMVRPQHVSVSPLDTLLTNSSAIQISLKCKEDFYMKR